MEEPQRPVIALSQRALFETSAVGIAITDGSRTILECNKTLAAMLGYDDPEELVGLSGVELTYPADTPEHAALIADSTERGEDLHIEKQYRRKDGTGLWVRLRRAPIAGTALYFSFFEDISDRKATEDALAEQATLLDRSQVVGGVGSWIWYPDENRSLWSEQAARIYGFTPQEAASGRPELYFGVVHPDDYNRVVRIPWTTLGVAAPTELEYRIVRRSDGEVRWLREHAQLELAPDGEPFRVVGAVADITDRKLVELDALRKTTMLERAHEVAGLGAYIVDIGRETIYVSAELARLLRAGNQAFEIPLAEYRRRFYLPERREAAAAEYERAYAAHTESIQREGRLIRGDGELIWVRSLEGRTEVTGESFMLGVTQDITEQKHVELELRETAAGLERAQQLGRVGTWAWYLPEGRTVYSAEALRMMGYPPDADGPDLLTSIIHPDDAKTMRERSEHAFHTGAAYSDEFRIVRDGEVRWLHAQGDVEYDATGTIPSRMVGVLMDITDQRRADAERRELEERLRQSQKLDALGQLAGGIAHDFNNLLTVITGASTLALMDATDDELRSNLGEIMHASTRASELTQKLLVFARRRPVERTALDLNDVVVDSRRLLERLIEPTIEIVEILSDEPLPVVADFGQLEQVLLNLALNARDAMPSGGRLTVRTAHDTDPAFGLISVEDTGTGIPRAVLDHIFEPFFTTKEAGKGTGLGLATAFGIVDAAGGEIRVASDDGAGTTFTVRLPLATDDVEAAAEPAPGAAPRIGYRQLRALLVDDDDHVRATLARLLEAAGCTSVVAVGSGSDALEWIKQDSAFDVLVTDLMMPQMNGIDLSQELHRHIPTLPTLFISGSSENAKLAASQPNGTFLAKPFSVTEVRGALERLLPSAR